MIISSYLTNLLVTNISVTVKSFYFRVANFSGKCSSGQEIDSTGGCSDCELNSYQPVNIPTFTDKCLSCKDNYGTKKKMSNKSYDCLREFNCLPGHSSIFVCIEIREEFDS